MKKAIIVLLLLAFVAGGLFAQEGLTFGGRVMAGIGMWKVGDADAGWGIATTNGSTRGMRLNFTATYRNADKNKGFNFYLRSRGAGSGSRVFSPAGPSGSAIEILYARGWFTAFDGLLYVEGGKMFDSPFGYGDWWGWDDPTDAAYGIQAQVRPNDKIKIGFGATNSRAIDVMGAFGLMNWFIGFRGDFGLVDARAYLKWRKEYLELHATATIGLDKVEIGIPVYVYSLTDFAASGELLFMPYVTFSGIENMNLGLVGHMGMEGADMNSDIVIGALLYADYNFGGKIIPRLGLGFVSGGTYNGMNTGIRESIWENHTYDKGDAFLLIRPRVRFRTSSTSWVDFAGIFDIQVGDNKPSNPINIGALVDFSVSF